MTNLLASEPVTRFEQHVSKTLASLRKTREPLCLTQQGERAAVVMSPETYDQLAADAEYARSLAAIRQSQQQFAEGKCRPAEEFFDEFFLKHGLSRSKRAKPKSRK